MLFIFILIALLIAFENIACGFLLSRKPQTSVRHLESNSWEIKLNDVTIFADPVLSQLNFGVPFLYQGEKRVVNDSAELVRAARNANLILITQGFDDHAHAPTLTKLNQLNNSLSYLCPPSAKEILLSSGIENSRITTIRPGESYTIRSATNPRGRDSCVEWSSVGPSLATT